MSDTITRARLSDLVHRQVGLSKKESGDLVDEVFRQLCDTLVSGERIKIAGFGNFNVSDKAARRGRNPQTGEAIIISRRRVVTFKPSQVMRQAFNPDSQN